MKQFRFIKFFFLFSGILNFVVSLWIWFYYEFMLKEIMKLPLQNSAYFELIMRGFLLCVMTFGLGYLWVGINPRQNRDLCLLSCLAKGGWPVIYLYYCFRYNFFQYGASSVLILWPAFYDLAFLPFFIHSYFIIRGDETKN